ncbi:hypothetical protein P9747_23375, partial [Paenibacillus macerans]|uniref:hypothetical protein n=1 Tax=Paenibacillus macerans TaxID=44252 RepID=UPI002E1BDA35|nr:hypothetical protein [Paenibacillus macerans]
MGCGLVGRSISDVRALCTIIPFDQGSREEDKFRRRKYICKKQSCSRSLDRLLLQPESVCINAGTVQAPRSGRSRKGLVRLARDQPTV